LNDFSKVLRKKHATACVLTAGMSIVLSEYYSLKSMTCIYVTHQVWASAFRQHYAVHSPAKHCTSS
jgi:hypothetical protein